MGILLGLLTAVTWGGSDFLARFATHRIGTLRTMFYMQATGLVLLSICLPWLGGWGHLHDGSGWQPWAWGVLAGCISAVSTLTLYRSFEVGNSRWWRRYPASLPGVDSDFVAAYGRASTCHSRSGNNLHHPWCAVGGTR